MGRWFDMAVQKGQLGAERSERELTAPFCTNCTVTSMSEAQAVCIICGRPADDSNSNLVAHRDGDRPASSAAYLTGVLRHLVRKSFREAPEAGSADHRQFAETLKVAPATIAQPRETERSVCPTTAATSTGTHQGPLHQG